MTWCHRESSLITKALCKVMTVLKRILWYWACHEQHSFRFLPVLFSWQSLNWKHHLMKTGSSVLGSAGWWHKFNNQGSSPRDQMKAWKSFTHTVVWVKISHEAFFLIWILKSISLLFFQHSQSKEKNCLLAVVNLSAVPGMVLLSVIFTKILWELWSTPFSGDQE